MWDYPGGPVISGSTLKGPGSSPSKKLINNK